MDNHPAKIKEILKGIDQEIEQYEKLDMDVIEHSKFIKGNIAGLRRARTTLEIFFHKDLKQEV